MTRYQDNLLMSTLDRVLPWLEGIKSDAAKAKVSTLLNGYSYLFADVLDRKVKRRERTEYYDVDQHNMILWLPAWPIGLDSNGDPLVALYNDAGVTPSYSTALTYLTDYRVYPNEEDQGRVEFIRELLEGPQALKVVYTGGLATKTVVGGTSGHCQEIPPGPVSTFSDTSATFVDDGVEADMNLVITDDKNGNAGTYPIETVVDNGNLQFDLTWPGSLPTPADEDYYIQEAGLIGSYPELEQAVITQVVFHWKQRDKLDIASMSLVGGAGMSTTFTAFKPLDLLPEVETALDALRRSIYP